MQKALSVIKETKGSNPKKKSAPIWTLSKSSNFFEQCLEKFGFGLDPPPPLDNVQIKADFFFGIASLSYTGFGHSKSQRTSKLHWFKKYGNFDEVGGFCLLLELHQEGSARCLRSIIFKQISYFFITLHDLATQCNFNQNCAIFNRPRLLAFLRSFFCEKTYSEMYILS